MNLLRLLGVWNRTEQSCKPLFNAVKSPVLYTKVHIALSVSSMASSTFFVAVYRSSNMFWKAVKPQFIRIVRGGELFSKIFLHFLTQLSTA